MIKVDIINDVSRAADITKVRAEIAVEAVLDAMKQSMMRGERIELRGFGSFRLRQREPRKGRNPKTGDKVDVPPKKVPYFKPGKELKELINRAPEAAITEQAADGTLPA